MKKNQTNKNNNKNQNTQKNKKQSTQTNINPQNDEFESLTKAVIWIKILIT